MIFVDTAPQTPNKKNKTTEDKIDTEVDLTVYHQKLDDWAVEIIGNIDAELSKRVLNPEGNEFEDTRMTRQIFTLGELAQICPHRINKRLFLLIQGIIFQEGKRSTRSRKDLPRYVRAGFFSSIGDFQNKTALSFISTKVKECLASQFHSVQSCL